MNQLDNKSFDKENIINNMTQKALNEQTKIMVRLIITLFISGVITLFLVLLTTIGILNNNNEFTFLIYGLTSIGIINIVLVIMSYRRMRKVKNQFENAEL